MPFAYRASLIIYPPLAVSLVKTQAYRSSIVAAIPRGSCSSKYSTWRCGATIPRKLLTRFRRTSNGSIRFEYAFLVRSVSEVTPQWRVRPVTRHAWVSKRLCPRCMWSKVPPTHTISLLKKLVHSLMSVSWGVDTKGTDLCLRILRPSFCSYYSCSSSITPIAGRRSSTANTMALWAIWSIGITYSRGVSVWSTLLS